MVIGVLAFGSFKLGHLLLLGSFGSSVMMVFSFPELVLVAVLFHRVSKRV